MEELQLPKGQSATFASSLNHGDASALLAAMNAIVPHGQPNSSDAALAMQKALGTALVDLLEMYVRAYIRGWTLLDEEGANIPFVPWPASADMARPPEWTRIPEGTFSALSIKAQQIRHPEKQDDPKDGSGDSGPATSPLASA